MSATPKHLWLVGIVSLLWNGVGAMNYVMTQFRVEAYMSSFTQEQLDYYYTFPAWAIAFWAVAVWFGVAGSVLLLLRKKIAEIVLLISLTDLAVVLTLGALGVLAHRTGLAVHAGLVVVAIAGFAGGMVLLRVPGSLGPLERLRSLSVFCASAVSQPARHAQGPAEPNLSRSPPAR